MKSKKMKHKKLIIGALALLVGVAAISSLLASDIATVTTAVAPKESAWERTKRLAREKAQELKTAVQQSEEYKQFVTGAKDFSKQAYGQIKAGAKQIYQQQIAPIGPQLLTAVLQARDSVVRTGKDAIDSLGKTVSEQTKNIVEKGTKNISDLAQKGVKGIGDVANAAIKWINDNLDPQKAQAAIAAIQAKAGEAAQSITNQAQDTAATNAAQVVEAVAVNTEAVG
jgi:F0F1-type ATP synthase membrane subunit b/b'